MMHLPTTAELPFGKSPQKPLQLGFQLVECRGSQPRFVGRSMLVPVLKLSDYSFRAVIDWVDIRVTLREPTQFQWIQKILDRKLKHKCWVTPINPGAGGESSCFDIRFQEPGSLARIYQICFLVFERYPALTAPIIQGIEVSIDATPKVQSDEKRALLLGAMQRTIFTSRDIVTNKADRVRSSIGTGEKNNRRLLPEGKITPGPSPSSLAPSLFSSPWIDGTTYFGEKNGEMMVRIMDKVIDQQNHSLRTRRDLEVNEKRVRIEVVLRGAELVKMDIAQVEAMKSFSFNKLQGKYFQFKLPTFLTKNVHGTAAGAAEIYTDCHRAEVFLIAGLFGIGGIDRTRASFRRRIMPQVRKLMKGRPRPASKYKPGRGSVGTLTSYVEMNKKVATALRQLGDREAVAWEKIV